MIIIQNLEPGSSKEESMKEFFSDIKQHQICPDVADESAITDRLGCPIWVETTKILPGPMAKNEYERATRLDAENLELKKRIKELESRDNVHRSDKGKKHRKHPKRSSDYGKTAKIVAEEFSLAVQTLEKGAKRVGTVSEGTIKQWDIKFPDADRRNKWGYYAQLRLSSKNKQEYQNVLLYWAMYWQDYKRHFLKWRKQHPASKRSSFRFTPLVRINNFHPEWIGRDDKDEFYNTPNSSTIDKQNTKHQ